MIWASMHGMCALQIGNRCIEVLSEEKRDNAVNLGFMSFIEMLESLNKKAN